MSQCLFGHHCSVALDGCVSLGNYIHLVMNIIPSCCAKSGNLWQVELVERKDRPWQLGRPMYEEMGKTVGLLLRLTAPIWFTGQQVILDSGFCVLNAIIELRKKCVFGAALIKK